MCRSKEGKGGDGSGMRVKKQHNDGLNSLLQGAEYSTVFQRKIILAVSIIPSSTPRRMLI